MIRSFIRPVNAAIAGLSFLSDSITGKTDVSGMPVSLSVEITNFCNLKCPECITGSGRMTRKKGFMEPDLFRKIIGEIEPFLLNLNLFFQGEPMLHPNFFSFITLSRKIRTTVSTNGHFLDEISAEKIVNSGLNELVVSLDGMDQASYAAYRIDGNIETVLTGIRNIADAKRRYRSSMKLVIQFLVNKHNEHQIHKARLFARKMKATLKLKSMQIINAADYTLWLPGIKRFSRYEIYDNEYRIKSSLPGRCARLWFSPVITWDGKVLPCCFDKDADHIMGDLNEESLRDIWNGPKYKTFRKSLLTGRHMIDICRNCTSGLSIEIHR